MPVLFSSCGDCFRLVKELFKDELLEQRYGRDAMKRTVAHALVHVVPVGRGKRQRERARKRGRARALPCVCAFRNSFGLRSEYVCVRNTCAFGLRSDYARNTFGNTSLVVDVVCGDGVRAPPRTNTHMSTQTYACGSHRSHRVVVHSYIVRAAFRASRVQWLFLLWSLSCPHINNTDTRSGRATSTTSGCARS